jgi:phosphohistidine phosphatase
MDEGVSHADLELYLLRHAHAGDAAEWVGDDSLRPLSAKGRRQAEKLGRYLVDLRFEPDSILTSPKLRALETAQIVGDALGLGVTTDDRLAMGVDLEMLENVLASDGGWRVMLVGHDPDFSELAASLVGAGYLPLKKGALARIDLSLPLAPGCGTLRWMLPPDSVPDSHPG